MARFSYCSFLWSACFACNEHFKMATPYEAWLTLQKGVVKYEWNDRNFEDGIKFVCYLNNIQKLNHGKKSSNFDIVFSLYIRGKRTISLPFPTQNAFYTSNFPPSFPTGKLRVKGNVLLPTVSRVRFNVSKSWKLSLH